MRFLVVCCENSTAWAPVDFAQMFTSKLARDDSEWITVNIANNETLPSTEDLDQFQGIILTGSRFNICDKDNYPWFDSVCEVIRHAASHGRPRVFGGCFGCQLIGHALGGEVSKNPCERFILKAEQIEPCQPFFSKIFPTMSPEKSSLTLIESHGYCVSSLPPNSQRLASSSSCTNELFVCGANANLLACQCHPEFDYGYAIRDRIWPSVVGSKRMPAEEIEESARSFEAFSDEDSVLFCSLISSFLHSTGSVSQQSSQCCLDTPTAQT
jgi:GMP synthase-like glutamine amidotransferase